MRLQKIASERQTQREELQAETLQLREALSAAQVPVSSILAHASPHPLWVQEVELSAEI